jgi:hypothetical protein
MSAFFFRKAEILLTHSFPAFIQAMSSNPAMFDPRLVAFQELLNFQFFSEPLANMSSDNVPSQISQAFSQMSSQLRYFLSRTRELKEGIMSTHGRPGPGDSVRLSNNTKGYNELLSILKQRAVNDAFFDSM